MSRAREVVIGPNDVRRVPQQTALDDYSVTLDPGTYALRFTTVDFRPCEPESAYWAMASIPCTRLHNGARWGKAGERGTYRLQAWAYTFDAGKTAS